MAKELGKKHQGDENLIPMNKRTKGEVREIARSGGIKSGEVRREKKMMADIYATVLAKKFKLADSGEEVTGEVMIGDVIASIVQRGDSASVSMIKELREGIDGTKLEHSGLTDFTALTPEEYEAKKAQFLLLHADDLKK